MNKKGWSSWELSSRMPTLEHAAYVSSLLTSVATPTKTKLKKEGREWSIYVSKKQTKIKQWGSH